MSNNTPHAAGTASGPWAKFVDAAKADPKKACILTVLAVALCVIVAKQLPAHGPGPSTALGSTSPEGTDLTAPARSATSGANNGASAFEEWRHEPIGAMPRNLFAIDLAAFPQDGIRTSAAQVQGDGFWDQLAKSTSNQTDAKSKRQTFVENLQTEAAKLRLQSTVMGATPKALINGDLVKEGDVVASFRVLKIEARRIIVEREGIKLEIPMN